MKHINLFKAFIFEGKNLKETSPSGYFLIKKNTIWRIYSKMIMTSQNFASITVKVGKKVIIRNF